MAVNHQHLRAFNAVANEGSFSKAARRLNISQPTLSQQIKALESRYRTNLFEARRIPLRLTPLGRELLRLTARMFETSEEIEALLRDEQADCALTVRIVSDSPTYAARLAQALMLVHPGAQVVVQIANAPATLQTLLDARADVAIACDPRIDPALVYKPLFTDGLRVVMPNAHVAAAGDSFPLELLPGECLLLREVGSRTRAGTQALLAARDIKPGRTVEMHSREAIREAVALGMGVSLFSASECPPDPRLACLPPDALPSEACFEEYLVFSAEHRRSVVVQAVLAAATQIGEPALRS
jgi:DNA-binding transcriptional LysR family regulator